MKYRNTKTGVVIDVKSVIGGKWEPVEQEEPPKPKKKQSKKTQKEKKA